MAFGSPFSIGRRRARSGVSAERHVRLDRCAFIGTIRVGFRSYANDSVLRDCEIGRFCSIGRRCTIGGAGHPLDRLSTHPSFMVEADFGARTTIGNDVWIGDGAVIVAGLTIGDGAVIGANAVVTRDVAPFAVIGGVPARLIRMRFDDATITRIAASIWWRYGDAAIGARGIDACLARLPGAPELPPHFQPYRA